VTTYPLIGVVGPVRGNEGRVVKMLPVIERDGDWWLVLSDHWTSAQGVRMMSSAERDDVRLIDEAQQATIAPGQVVWMAGPRLMQAYEDLAFRSEFSPGHFSNWRPLWGGFIWRCGAAAGLKSLVITLNEESLHALTRLMFGGSASRDHRLERLCFGLFMGTSDYRDEANWLVCCAMFYRWDSDLSGLQGIRRMATARGVFANDSDFESAWKGVYDDLGGIGAADGPVYIPRDIAPRVSAWRSVATAHFSTADDEDDRLKIRSQGVAGDALLRETYALFPPSLEVGATSVSGADLDGPTQLRMIRARNGFTTLS